MTKIIRILYIIIIINLPLYAQIDSVNLINKNIGSDTLIKPDTISIAKKSIIINKNAVLNNILDTSKISKLLPTSVTSSHDSLNINSLNILNFISYWSVLRVLLLLCFGLLLNKLIDTLRKNKRIKYSVPFLHNVIISIKIILWVTIGYILIHQLFSKTTELMLVFVILVFIFIGISLLGLLKNITGGFYLSLKIPFELGDYIVVDNFEGIVKQITWLNTKIISNNDTDVNIPNSIFIYSPVKKINIGEKEKAVNIDFLFSHNYSIEFLKKIIFEAALSSPYTYIKTEPKVFLINSDYVSKTFTFRLSVFVIDSQFKNDLQNSINLFINKEITNEFDKR